MGIDRDLADFLLCARNNAIDFSRTGTLGRLNLFMDVRSLQTVFRKHGVAVTGSDISAMRSIPGGYCEEFLRQVGARDITSIDASGYEEASVVHDMNLPIDAELKRRFSVLIDGGTLEHIFNFPVAIRNCMEMLDIGGHFFIHTMANNFMGHGFYQFSPELFYRVLSPKNGFVVHRVVMYELRVGKPRWYEAADPQTIGERVELINQRPTYMLVHAQRVADVPLFATVPQQSDYSAMWSQNAPPRAHLVGLRKRLHSWAKTYNDLFLRLLPGFVYDRLLSALVRGLPRRGFRRGQYAKLPTLMS